MDLDLNRQSLTVRTWASHLRCLRLGFLTYERGRVSDITWVIMKVKWDNNVMYLVTIITWQISAPSFFLLKWKVDESRIFLSIIKESETIKKPYLRDLLWAVCLCNWKSQRYQRHLCFWLWRISSAWFSGRHLTWPQETRFYLQLYHVVAAWPWKNHLFSLFLFHHLQNRKITLPNPQSGDAKRRKDKSTLKTTGQRWRSCSFCLVGRALRLQLCGAPTLDLFLGKLVPVDTVGEKRSFSWQHPLLNTLPLWNL